MATFDVVQKMELLMCGECGAQFAVAQAWSKFKIDESEAITCPSGHENFYERSNGSDAIALKAENDRLKRELVQAIHDADQAAAAREAGVIKPLIVEPDREPEPGPAANPPSSYWHKCPKCDRTYKKIDGHLRRHLLLEHKLPIEEVRRIIGEIAAAKMAEK